MLLVRMYYDSDESMYISRLNAADIKACFDLNIPCYILTEATEELAEGFFLINAISENETGLAGSLSLVWAEDGKLTATIS